MKDGLPEIAVVHPHDELEQVLRAAQFVVLQHPVAAQAAFAALVAEGRRHASTPEGQARRARLGRSPLLRRVREAFEVGTFNLLEADPQGVLPSAYVDVVMLAAGAGGLEPLLARLAAGVDAE